MPDNFSDLGAQPIEDYSDLGAVPINSQPQNQTQNLNGGIGPYGFNLNYQQQGPVGVFAGNTLKGLGQVGANVGNIINKYGQPLTGGLIQSSPELARSLANTSIPNPFQNAAPASSSTSPVAASAGNFVGQSLPFLATPEIDLAGAIGRGSTSAADYLANTQLGKFIGRGLNNVATGATTGGLSAPILNQNSNSQQSAITGSLEGGAIGAIISAALGIAGMPLRFIGATSANVSKLAGEEGDAYNAIRSQTESTGFKTNPQQYANNLQQLSQELENSATGHVNEPLASDINNRLNNLSDDFQKPNGFTVDGIHGLMRGMNNQINSYIRSGNYDAARIYNNLKQSLQGDMLNSLQEQGHGDAADLFQQTQKNWAQNIVPLRNNPTSLGKVGGQAALITAFTHLGLPAPVETAAAVAFGLHQPSYIKNALSRYGSTYNGGPASALNTLQPPSPLLTNAVISGINQLGGNQQ